MIGRGLYVLPLGLKVFASLFLCLLGLAYVSFLAGIWLDTGIQIPLIAEAYGGMSVIELVAHTSRYLAWFAAAFGAAGGLFLFSAYPDKWKLFFSFWAPAWILSDIASAWLIRMSGVFAWLLFISGFFLAATFLALFILVQRDLWFKK